MGERKRAQKAMITSENDLLFHGCTRALLAASLLCAVSAVMAIRPAFADGAPGQSEAAAGVGTNVGRLPLKVRATAGDGRPTVVRDSLKVEPNIALKDTPAKEIVLPGVLKIDGVASDMLDPGRAKQISMTNGGSQTVWLSADEPNRIQLPFTNAHVVATTDITVDKRPT